MVLRLRGRTTGCVKLSILVWFASFLATTEFSHSADSPNPAAIRRAIERSVPFIEREGDKWNETKACVSCHHTAFQVWSLKSAQQAGATIDTSGLKRRTEWASDWHHLSAPPTAPADLATAAHGQSETLAELLLGNERYGAGKDRPAWVAAYSQDVAKEQQADGSWISGGQLPSQKRPKRETQEVTTMWNLLALKASGTDVKALKVTVDKARAWLGNATIGESTEWWAVRLLVERQFRSESDGDHYRDELIKRQRADGGWGWLCKDDSDALGTGLAIFALSSEKAAQRLTAIAKAQQFLVGSQGADGSWAVHGTKENAKDRVVPTATYWGTCWAVIGLGATIRD